MNVVYRLTAVTDEFGNLSFERQKFYEFDKYIVLIIKEFIFKRKYKKNYGILSLTNHLDIWNIHNQFCYGFYLYTHINKSLTNKQNINIDSRLLNIDTTKVFVEIIDEYDDVYICNVYKPRCISIDHKYETHIHKQKLINRKMDIKTYQKTNTKLAKIYINKNQHLTQLEITNSTQFTTYSKNIHGLKNTET